MEIICLQMFLCDPSILVRFYQFTRNFGPYFPLDMLYKRYINRWMTRLVIFVTTQQNILKGNAARSMSDTYHNKETSLDTS